MRSRDGKRLGRIMVPLLVVALAAAAAMWLVSTRPEVPAAPPRERSWPVEVMTASVGEARPLYRLDGEVVAGRVAALRPRVTGPLVEVAEVMRDGGAVAAGALLTRIDRFDYEAAVAEREADVAEARAGRRELEAELASERLQVARDRDQLDLARRDLERRETLFAQGAVPQRSLDEARLLVSEREQRLTSREQTVARLEARLEQARARVARAESLLARARRDLADTELRAPFDAFLEEVEAAVGRVVSASDRLARLIDANDLEVRFHVPDAIYGRLAEDGLKGRPLRVRWRMGDMSVDYEAVVDRVDSRIRGASGGVDVFARLEGPGLRTSLRPGAFVAVEVVGRRHDGVARLPLRALHDDAVVYVVVDGRLERRAVEAVTRFGGEVLVRGEVADGDAVVLTRFPEIAAGLRVSVP